MGLNQFRSGQIKDTDHVTEAELSSFDLHQNIFLTKASATTVKVTATADIPATLTIKGILCSNTSDTSAVTVSGSTGERQVFAVRDEDTTVKTFTLEVVDNDTPSDANLSRKIATLQWDGSSISRIKWNLSSRLQIEKQVPGTNGQTVFTLTDIIYTPGREELLVFVNGMLQVEGINYDETDSSTITFTDGSGIDTECELVFVKINSNNFLG